MAADIAIKRLHISANGGTKHGEFVFVSLVRKSTFLSRRPQCLLKCQARRESHTPWSLRGGLGQGKVLGISSPCTTWRQGRRIEMGLGLSTSTICSIDPMVTDIYKGQAGSPWLLCFLHCNPCDIFKRGNVCI